MFFHNITISTSIQSNFLWISLLLYTVAQLKFTKAPRRSCCCCAKSCHTADHLLDSQVNCSSCGCGDDSWTPAAIKSQLSHAERRDKLQFMHTHSYTYTRTYIHTHILTKIFVCACFWQQRGA